MNRERLKTYVLVTLLILSIFLTQQLLIEIPNNLIPSFGQKAEDPQNIYILSDIISPEKYIINYSEDDHTVLYSSNKYKIWPEVKTVLKNTFEKKDIAFIEITDEEFNEYKLQKSTNLCFPLKIPTHIFAKMLELYNIDSLYSEIKQIDNLHIYLGAEPYIVFSDGEKHTKVDNIKSDIEGILREVNRIKSDGYVNYYPGNLLAPNKDVYTPLEIQKDFHNIYVENDISIKDSQKIKNLTEGFFNKKIDYIRKVVENNGTNIYIYDQKGLVITENGVIEYFDVIKEPVFERDLYTSLTTTVNFISENDIWPSDAYLSSIEEIESKDKENKGYKLKFSYRTNGRSVILNKSIVQSPIEIEVFNEYIKTYKRYLRDETIKTLKISTENTWQIQDVIRKNLSTFKDRYIKEKGLNFGDIEDDKLKNEVLASINDIQLAYYDTCEENKEEKLIPVWVIDIGQITYVIDNSNGDIIYEESIR